MNTTLASTPTERRPLDAYLAEFETFEQAATKHLPPWLRTLRTSGISYFAELGLPTLDQEEWRFTNPAPLVQFPFVRASQLCSHGLTKGLIQPLGFGSLKTHRLVFVDGHFVPELSTLIPPSQAVTLASLAAAVHWQPDSVEAWLGRVAHHQNQPFTALNTAFMQDGAFIHLPSGAVLETPVHLLFIARAPGVVSQPRNLIVAGAHSQVRVIEDYVSWGNPVCFTNAVTEIIAGEGARVEHARIQRQGPSALHVGAVETRQQRGSRLLSHSISLGSRLARHDLGLRFEGEGGESILNGLYVAGGEQLVDHHTLADHASPHCSSHEFYHGILGGKGKGVFNGRISVRRDAQKTDAKQTNRNLLLSDDASINAKPQLEILADDVKCTHGATVGQLDEEALFYLRSRGLGESQARQMLVKAFASDVLNRITIEPLRETLDGLLSERLQSGSDLAPVPLPPTSNAAGKGPALPSHV
jgi:Fe-S cluster assembly protein SufD